MVSIKVNWLFVQFVGALVTKPTDRCVAFGGGGGCPIHFRPVFRLPCDFGVVGRLSFP